MWKALLLLAFVASFDMVFSWDDCGKCGPNERYVACPDTMCIPQNCSQRGLPVPCPILGPEGNCPSKPACICIENYLRDDSTGECIPSKKCEPPATTTTSTESPHKPSCGCGGHPPKCGKNEVWNNCSDTSCLPTRCSELGYPLKCDKKCKPGCVCKNDCVRDDNGVCIPIKNCPSCGGDKNAESGCGTNCGKTCATYKIKNPICPLICRLNGCDCRDGYVYDPAVKACVRPKDCTPICKVNEEYSPCINGGCGPKNCSQLGQPDVCIDPKTCIKGCVCVKGYLRAANGTCVPIDKCPPPDCPKGEVWDKCPTVKCDGDWCAKTRDSPQTCPVGIVCDKPRCVCGYNMKRDWKTGKCIPIPDCPPFKCDCNEEYKACSENCPGDKCSTSKPICPKTGITANCSPKCRCTKGNCRNSEGKCVPESKCDGLNEYWEECIKGCSNQTCDSINQTYHCPLQKGCKSGCRCRPGFYRNGRNICVPEDECPKKCGKNEHWEECFYSCGDGESCEDIGKKYNCPAEMKCRIGCRCDKGYRRNKNNLCIPECECPPTCKVNEEYSPCINGGCGPKNCSQLGQPDVCIDPKTCIKGCVCVKGYLRAANGTCVPTDKCPPPDCPKDEVWSKCPTIRCDGDWCAKTRDSPQWCTGGIVCDKPRCVCDHNRKRDWKTGKCIPIPDCPPFKCDNNEEYQACPPSCPGEKCNEIDKQVCPKIDSSEICRPKCRCTKGNCRNSEGKCVPDVPTCKVNEEYSPCINGGCGPKNCSQLGQPDVCVDPKTCIKGCVCVKGYLRAANGTCVPTDKCPPPDCPKGEVWDKCPTVKCDGDWCAKTRDSPQTCPVGIVCDKPRCVCGYNMKRDWKTGKCIPIPDCPPFKCDCNEEYKACPPSCPGDKCSTRKPICPRIGIIVNCRPQCRCTKGNCRNSEGNCVPELPTCKVNEEYSPCINGGCGPKNCSQLGQPDVCMDPKICIKGCVCVKGYLRAANGTCVPIDKCPPPECPKGEVWDKCPTVKCDGDWCAKTRDSPQTCPVGIVCDKPRCVCGHNMKRDWKTGKCIPIPDCPPFKCDCDEEYKACPPSCPGDKCSTSKPICPKTGIIVNCRPQCRCTKGNCRNSEGKCVPDSPQCPKGEVWDKCPTVKCDGDWCAKTRDSPQTCPVGIVCDKPRCVCGHNMKRDWKTGKCIPIPDCPPFKCNCNEEYQACSPSCPSDKCTGNDKRVCPKIGIIANCRPQCRCTKGFCRNNDGNCVLACKCAANSPADKR